MQKSDWEKVEKDVEMMMDAWTVKGRTAFGNENKMYAQGVRHGYEVVLKMIKDLKANKYPRIEKSAD